MNREQLHYLAFNDVWFNKNQKLLLFLLNNKITKRFFRKILGVSSDLKITDNVFRVGSSFVEVLKGKSITRTIGTANYISKNIYNKFKLFWWALHYWDEIIADKFIPRLSYGFYQLTIQPTSDTTGYDASITDGSDANTNFNNQYFRLGYRTVWNRNSRVLIKFDLSTIPAGANIVSAIMSIYIASTDEAETGDNNYGAYRITADWNETTVTWNTQPAIATVESTTLIAHNATGYQNFTITQMVKDWLATTYTNYGTLIKNPTTGQKPHFNGYLSGNGTNTPKLVVTYNFDVNDERESEITGSNPNYSDEREAEIHGTVLATDERESEVHGIVAVSDERDSEITGVKNSDERESEITGLPITNSDERGSEITGYVLVDEHESEITGKEQGIDEIDSEITGTLAVSDERDSEILGSIPRSERDSQIIGRIPLTIPRTYRIIVKDENGDVIGEFDKFRKLTFGKRLNNYGTASFEIPISDAKTASLINLRVYTVWIYRQENATSTLVWAGEQAMRDVTIDNAGNGWVTVHCYTWLEQFNSRYTASYVEFDGVDAGQIAWSLIDTTQNDDDGDFGVTEGTIETTINRVRHYYNQNIMEAIINLANVISGFDFEITDEKVFNVASVLGEDKTDSVVLEYGHNISSVRITEDFVTPINRAIVLGQATDEDSLQRIDTNDTDLQGAYKLREFVLNEMDISESDTFIDKGEALIRKYGLKLIKVEPELTKSSKVNITKFSLGDAIRLKVQYGVYNIDTEYRVFEWEVTYNSDNSENMSLVLGNFTL